PEDTVLDVGLRNAAAGSFAFGSAPARSLVSSCAIDPTGGELLLDLSDASFDWVFCGELIEHADSLPRQQELVAECFRVARKGVFITTPSRRHPLEFNSGLPFVHWLPAGLRRRVRSFSTRLGRVPPALL